MPANSPVSPSSSRGHLLQSWKEIATYLQRGVRTVQRWQEMGLPVRRLGSGPRSPVMADARDLDRWLQGAQLHGFKSPQPAEHLIARGMLSDSIQQSRQLQEQMHFLRASTKESLQRLIGILASMEKSCVSSYSDPLGTTHSLHYYSSPHRAAPMHNPASF